MARSSNDRDGKRWEDEVKSDLSYVRGLYLKSGNSTLPDNDFYGTYRGLSVRCECKTTTDEALPWSRFQGAAKSNQKRTLQRNHETGGLSFLAISREVSLYERQVWVCTWENFLQLSARQPAGGSFSLVDPVNHMLEAIPLRPEGWLKPKSLPYNDYQPFLEREFARYLVRQMSAGLESKSV